VECILRIVYYRMPKLANCFLQQPWPPSISRRLVSVCATLLNARVELTPLSVVTGRAKIVSRYRAWIALVSSKRSSTASFSAGIAEHELARQSDAGVAIWKLISSLSADVSWLVLLCMSLFIDPVVQTCTVPVSKSASSSVAPPVKLTLRSQ